MTWECLQNLTTLGNLNKVTLAWVPGHVGIAGNEKADQLAKRGAQTPLTGPEPGVGISRSCAKRTIESWELNQHQNRWSQTNGARHSKLMMRAVTTTRTKEILKLKREDLQMVTGLITGHCATKQHLHTLGVINENPRCRFCSIENETATHLIFNCEALTRRRFEAFGTDNLVVEDLTSRQQIKGLLRFAKELNL